MLLIVLAGGMQMNISYEYCPQGALSFLEGERVVYKYDNTGCSGHSVPRGNIESFINKRITDTIQK